MLKSLSARHSDGFCSSCQGNDSRQYLSVGRSLCDGALLPNPAGVPWRSFVQALGTSRLRSSTPVLP